MQDSIQTKFLMINISLIKEYNQSSLISKTICPAPDTEEQIQPHLTPQTKNQKISELHLFKTS